MQLLHETCGTAERCALATSTSVPKHEVPPHLEHRVHKVTGLLMWGALSDERTGLSFTVAAGPRQRSHSRVRVLRDSQPYFAVSDSRLRQSGGPGPRIYIPQEQGGPVMSPGTGFPLRRLVRLARRRWRYSNPPPHGPLIIVCFNTYLIPRDEPKREQ
jgi:hypothetical protein